MEETGNNSDGSDDSFEDCAPPVASNPDDVILPSEASPSQRSAPVPNVEPGQLLLSSALPPIPRSSSAYDDVDASVYAKLYSQSTQPPPTVYHPPPVQPGTRLVRIKDRVVQFKRATCTRASRAARPSEPSPLSRKVCLQLIQTREAELKRMGRTKLSADDVVRYRSSGNSGGRGPAIRAQVEQEQARMNHLAALKARNVDTYNSEASFLLWGNTSEQCYDKLAEAALRANAGNSSVTKRRDTQGAAYQ
tara:strand:- start:58 stop:804 length:747 start_codon:yes stop_codon:yes gene_type:complete